MVENHINENNNDIKTMIAKPVATSPATAEETHKNNIKKSLQIVVYGLPTNLNKKLFHKYLTHSLKLRKLDVELLQVNKQ